MKPEFIRFEFPLVGEPTRDPEATCARAMDIARAKKPGYPEGMGQAFAREWLLSEAAVRLIQERFSDKAIFRGHRFITTVLQDKGAPPLTMKMWREAREYRRKHGKGPYNLLPGEELC